MIIKPFPTHNNTSTNRIIIIFYNVIIHKENGRQAKNIYAYLDLNKWRLENLFDPAVQVKSILLCGARINPKQRFIKIAPSSLVMSYVRVRAMCFNVWLLKTTFELYFSLHKTDDVEVFSGWKQQNSG